MIHFLILICCIFPHPIFADESNLGITDVGIIILSEPDEYHEELFEKKKKEILDQATSLKQLQVNIYRSYDLQEDGGHWIILPLLEKLYRSAKFGDQNHEWLFFLEDLTQVNLKYLQNVFRKYNSSEDVFVGYVLQDTDPTIIHHFANPTTLSYPHFFAGFFVSSSLLQRLASMLPSWNEDYSNERSPANNEYSFSIDPMYELAKCIWDVGGVKLQHEEQLCLVQNNQNCATWIEEEFPNCGLPLEPGKLHIGVKTCHKFYNDRITVVKNTWGLDDDNIKMFSDTEDSLIPTIKVNVENVAHGHCEKTLSILKYYLENNMSFDWLAIVDDDTLISIKRLKKLLPCYNASVARMIGERYGYGVGYFSGYDYITGGGGMIFSHPAVKLVTAYCKCGSIDSPDDMIIGMCLKAMGIPVTHSPYFHQARPSDYSPYFLKPFKHISFHKHWMIDPYSVYKEWLQDSPDPALHTEL